MDSKLLDCDAETNEPSLDKDYLLALRDLRVLQDRDKEHRNVVCAKLQRMPEDISAKRLVRNEGLNLVNRWKIGLVCMWNRNRLF